MRRRGPRAVRALAAALALVGLVGLAGCSGLEGTGDVNFVAGGGAVTQIAPDERGEPVEAAFPTLDGEDVDLADTRGEVVVINFWGSWCNPCRAEAPTFAEASEEVDAVFLGAQLRAESRDNALGFEREFGIEYPTFEDSGGTLLALGRYAPNAQPATVFLDPEGRVAAIVNGAITSTSTIEGLVEDARG